MTEKEWVDIVSRLITVVFERMTGWPVMFLSIAFILRGELGSLLARVSQAKVSHTGVDVSFTGQVQSTGSLEKGLVAIANPTPNFRDPKLQFNTSNVVRSREALIRRDLEQLQLNTPTDATVDLLVNHLALTQCAAAAERLYRLIFGSQIAILKCLNTRTDSPEAPIRAIYGEAKGRYPAFYESYSFEEYIQFLVSWELITVTADHKYKITETGREFLGYMVSLGLSDEKGG